VGVLAFVSTKVILYGRSLGAEISDGCIREFIWRRL